ncbi:MAG: response regulator [Candidatus Viridilinea halotolerans]|uniref:Response regulator n=1 Tax=Candidatus Viridilinea halotolerans TaxID=2491704 RepID=A0A426U416_9CHLR|nr:MAG: response regulator [Candidatus Viridilinea halotolerans]
MSTERQKQTLADLAALHQSYVAQLDTQIEEIGAGWSRLRAGIWHQADVEQLRRQAHNLAGSGATFGLPVVSEAARTLDDALQRLLSGERLSLSQLAALDAEVLRLEEAAVHGPWLASNSFSTSNIFHEQPEATTMRIYIACSDVEYGYLLASQIAYFGYETRSFTSGNALLQAAYGQRPDLAILDLDLEEGERSGIEVAKYLSQLEAGPLPLIFIAAPQDFAAHLAVVRAGGRAYLTRPVDVSMLIDQIDQITQRVTPEPYTVLIVDDSPLMAEAYALALRVAGMRVTTTSDPLQAPALLADLQPDLLLLDMYMPECSGPELAAVFRQQPEYHSMPIVFLSGEADRNAQLAALTHGGDDFLTKPIDLKHLVIAISSRIQRARTMRRMMVRDGLTGLFNHSVTHDLLMREVSRARRTEQPLAVALIDLDNFKRVNDQYGHPVGDRILRSLARMLRQRLRITDLVGRYGGEEFIAVLPETTAANALLVIDSIRERFGRIEHQTNLGPLRVTFSAGVAELQPNGEPSMLVALADLALYQAKRHGRNQVSTSDAAMHDQDLRHSPLAAKLFVETPAATILVVDDDPNIRELFQLWLTASGYRVEAAASGSEALNRIAQGGIDVAIIDLSMPEVSGLDVLIQLRRQSLDPAVIMTTAFGSEQIAISAMRHGANDYLRKPLEYSELRTTIERTLATQRLRHENAMLQRRLDKKRRELEAELKQAAQIQADMLPQRIPRLPGYTLAARCIPAREVGGDFYDWHFPAPTILNLTFGDVMGKGMSAALLMTTTRAVIRSVARETSPEVNMRYAVKALHEDLERAGSFVTLCHVQLDLAAHHIAYVDAGHGLSFIRRHGGTCDRLEPRGMPVGVVANPDYVQGEDYLAPGDVLILFSDGLLDPWPALAHDPFQINDLLSDGMEAEAIIERLLALPALIGPLTDDLTMVVLARAPAQP